MSDTEMKEICKKRDSESSKSTDHGEGNFKNNQVETDDPEVGFIQPNHQVKNNSHTTDFTGLSKDELLEFAKDPFWKKVRMVLFILFWVLWAAMLVAAILIIVFTPKCPTIPKQAFWQKKTGYMLDVSKFKDTNGDGVGDIKGVTEKLGYLSTKAGFIILQSVIAGSVGDASPDGRFRSHTIMDFKAIDKRLGTKEDLNTFLKTCRQKNMKAIIEFHPHVGLKHPWFLKALKSDAQYQKYFLWNKTGNSKMVNRVGEKVWNRVSNGYFWSSFYNSLPALNLTNPDVLLELKKSVQFWLNAGFDGIFINDVAFLAPEISTTDIGKGLAVTTKRGNLKLWYSTGHKGQLYTAGSVNFIKEVRKWVDEVKQRSDRERLFLVSPGNTGLRHNRSQTLSYLGDAKAEGAHSVVLFDLVKNLGAKEVKPASLGTLKDRLNETLSSVNVGRSMFITQTISGPRSTDVTTTFINLLLPGTPLTVYGEEIGMSGYSNPPLSKRPLNPILPYSFITKRAMMFYPNDIVDAYNVPMQWSFSGGFTSNKRLVRRTFPRANVMSMSALGRGMTRYNIFEELVKLREKPSMNWGKVEWFQTEELTKPKYYIFSRSAEGFPKYVAILIEPTKHAGGIARDLSAVCKKATSKLAFPLSSDFNRGSSVPMKNVYFKFHSEGSVYLFECM